LALAASCLAGGLAFATPFEPATIPDQVQAVGHLDVDLLRQTQIFNQAGGQTAIEAAIDEAPPELQPLARSLSRSVRGVSFCRDSDHGAIYLETRDSRGLAQLVGKLPVRPARTVDGCSTYQADGDNEAKHLAVFGDTLVLADTDESLEQSI